MSVAKRALNATLVVTFATMTVMTALQVFFRYVLANPLLGSEEVALLAAVWMTFLGAAVATRDGTHIAVDVVVEQLPARWACVARTVSALATLTFALFLVVVGTRLALFSHSFESAALRMPMSLFFSALPLSSALIAGFAVARLCAELRNAQHR
jgi:TRAP-type C4-dicarboxylate transport system permease small subunit